MNENCEVARVDEYCQPFDHVDAVARISIAMTDFHRKCSTNDGLEIACICAMGLRENVSIDH